MDGATLMTVVKPVWDWLSPVAGLVVADMVSRWMRKRKASNHGCMN